MPSREYRILLDLVWRQIGGRGRIRLDVTMLDCAFEDRTEPPLEVSQCLHRFPFKPFLVEDPKRWNVACDFAINPLIVDAGLSLPDGVLIDNRFRGMSAEQIYNLLESESKTEQDSGKEEGEGEPRERNLRTRPPLAASQTSLPLRLPKAELAKCSMHHCRTKKRPPLKNRRGSGMWRSTRPRRLRGRRARFRPVSTGPWKGRPRHGIWPML